MSLEQLKQYDLVYLATPYTRFAIGHHAAFFQAVLLTSQLLGWDIKVYSPILEGHPLTYAGHAPTDVEFWIKFCQPKIDKSDALLIGELDGWRFSEGIAREYEIFTKLKKPVFYVRPAPSYKDLRVVSDGASA